MSIDFTPPKARTAPELHHTDWVQATITFPARLSIEGEFEVSPARRSSFQRQEEIHVTDLNKDTGGTSQRRSTTGDPWRPQIQPRSHGAAWERRRQEALELDEPWSAGDAIFLWSLCVLAGSIAGLVAAAGLAFIDALV